jgi:hypothetical protein
MTRPFKKKGTLDENLQQILTSNADCIKKLKETSSFCFFASYDFPFSCHLLVLNYCMQLSIYLITILTFQIFFDFAWFGLD